MNVSYNIVDRRSTKGANEKARGDCLGLFVGSPCWARTSDIMINSLIAPQHSRLTHFDALLTLNASYSLFRLSPVEKQYLIVFLGPSLYRAVGIGTTVKQNIIGLSLTRKKTKASNQMVTRFCLAPPAGLEPATS